MEMAFRSPAPWEKTHSQQLPGALGGMPARPCGWLAEAGLDFSSVYHWYVSNPFLGGIS